MKEEKITIITVVYNLIKSGRTEYFEHMIDSVKSQTYNNIEHIIIDGASTDGTLEFLKKYQEKGQIKVYSEKDNGPYDAMNKGIKKAQSDYVILLHSDDYFYDETAIEMQMKYLKMTNSDYVTGDTIFIDKNDNEVVPYLGIANRYDSNLRFLRGDNTHVFWIETSFNHEGMLMKKSVFEKVGYFGDQKIYGTSADFKFEIDLILKDIKHTHIPYNILCFRIGGASSAYDEKFYNILKYFYSKFYFKKINNIKEYDKLRQCPDKLFVYGLKKYLRSLELKNFDYEKCENFLDLMLSKSYCHTVDYNPNIQTYNYSILGIPILRIKTNESAGGGMHVKLFNLLPILKVKKDIKGNKTYKLFSFLPIFRIKRKQ